MKIAIKEIMTAYANNKRNATKMRNELLFNISGVFKK